MSKGVSSFYSRAALYMLKPIWGSMGGKKKPKRSPNKKLRQQRVLLERQTRKLRSTSTKREAIWLLIQSSLTTDAVTVSDLRRKHEAFLATEARQKAAVRQTMQVLGDWKLD